MTILPVWQCHTIPASRVIPSDHQTLIQRPLWCGPSPDFRQTSVSALQRIGNFVSHTTRYSTLTSGHGGCQYWCSQASLCSRPSGFLFEESSRLSQPSSRQPCCSRRRASVRLRQIFEWRGCHLSAAGVLPAAALVDTSIRPGRGRSLTEARFALRTVRTRASRVCLFTKGSRYQSTRVVLD